MHSIRGLKDKDVIAYQIRQSCLYWKIGNAILEKQEAEGWGAKVIDRMSKDIGDEFPDMKGFSARNIKYMRKFALSWDDYEFVQQVVAQIPWRTNIKLPIIPQDMEMSLDKVTMRRYVFCPNFMRLSIM